MSIKQLHDLLSELKDQASGLSIEEVERRQNLAEIIENLEEQILSNRGFEVESDINEQIENEILHFEVEYPAVASVLGNIMNILKSIGI